MQFFEYYNQYIKKLNYILNHIELKSIEELIQVMIEVTKQRKKIYLIGNGGSASTCEHMVTDFGVGCIKAEDCKFAFPIISLCNNNAVITAVSNDVCYENIYSHQLKLYCNKGDLLIAISASGNSENLIRAVEYANQNDIKTFGIVGFDGGVLKQICNKSIYIESELKQYGLVEDVMLILNHVLSNWIKLN